MSTLAIYPGSFNPFHKGHYEILLKAEKIFDKVIIARGVNTEKPPSSWPIPKIVQDRAECIEYNGLLTDCIEGLIKANPNDKVTVIRGLRNIGDFQHELTQLRYFQDLMPSFQMVSIFADKEFDHISSSGIRTLAPFGYDKIKKYML